MAFQVSCVGKVSAFPYYFLSSTECSDSTGWVWFRWSLWLHHIPVISCSPHKNWNVAWTGTLYCSERMLSRELKICAYNMYIPSPHPPTHIVIMKLTVWCLMVPHIVDRCKWQLTTSNQLKMATLRRPVALSPEKECKLQKYTYLCTCIYIILYMYILCYSYSMGTGIYGSKLPESEGTARGQGFYYHISYYISNLWLATNHEQDTHARRYHSNRGYKLETTAGVNETAETFARSLTVLSCTLESGVLQMLTWQHLDHSSLWLML